jgi:hypothetical protein
MAFYPKLVHPSLSSKNNVNFISTANQTPFFFGGSDFPNMIHLKPSSYTGSGFSNKRMHQKISGSGLLVNPSSYDIISKTFKKKPIK